jgi:asparagine synthase (glutamine-hydrolysing)
MCGIAGIVNFKERIPQEEAIRMMTNCIAHRGPDAQGIYVDNLIALGHRRLSIIDVSEAANQPLWDHKKRFAIIFNGEIYNYRELRSQYPDYPYQTRSDAEVILAYYEKYGIECLSYLNGMFGLAIWDLNEKSLLIARDRIGEKPVFYFADEQKFLFSSEIRSLLESGMVPKKLNNLIIPEYLMYQAPMGTNSMVEGIRQLSSGNYILIKDAQWKEVKYWSYDHAVASTDNLELAKNKIKELFLDSVRLRMVSDVPFGAFLSGGIDSSLVVACMAELSSQPVNSFNICFDEKEYDESGYAELIAKKYKTNHHRILARPSEFLDIVPEVLAAMDSPSGDGPNTYLVAKHIRANHVKVALSGLGGDELFAGYDKFLFYQRSIRNHWMSKLPKSIRHLMANVLSKGNKNRAMKLTQLMELSKWDLPTVYPLLRRAYSRSEANELLKIKSDKDQVEENLELINANISWMESFSKCTVGEMETYTRDVLLHDTDQMAMAHALEVRVPFFDHRLVEYVLSLPDKFKYPHKPKQLLVDSLAPRLPAEIVHRKKMGFTLPFDHWLRKELHGFADQKIKSIAERPEFNSDAVLKKWNDFRKGDQSVLWIRIWQLIVLSDWLERNKL